MPKKKPDTPASPPAHAISSALPSTCRPSCLSWRAAPLLNSQGRTPCRTWVQKSWSIVLGFELQFKKRMNPPSHTLNCDRLDRAESSKPSAAPRTKSSALNVTSRRSIAGQVLPIRTAVEQLKRGGLQMQTQPKLTTLLILSLILTPPPPPPAPPTM